jgi:putative transcriptional regulator
VKNRIRELRDSNGWTQADLARELDVSRQTVNALEAGRWDPSLTLAFSIASLFGEAVEAIFDPETAARRP